MSGLAPNATTHVAVAQTSTAATLVADSWTLFPTPPFDIRVEDEIEKVISIDANTATVYRGFGTPITLHPINATITAFSPVKTIPIHPSRFIPSTLRMVIPLLTMPAQALSVELNGQSCNLRVYQRTTGLYVDLGINQQRIISGVLALDRIRVVRDAYLGFVGDIAFWDSQGQEHPYWTGLNKRFHLGYFYPTT